MPSDVLAHLTAALADRYRVEREIGQGGMATVYLAEDLKHRRRVAVKVLRPELAATLGSDRFFREIEIAAHLSHPHILPLLDSGEAGDFLYYVMPYVEGESLRERLARQGELPIQEATRLLAEVVDALAHAHRRGVVHRDIKPDNIMLSERHALVMDFGVAKAVSEATGRQSLTTVGVALGTPAYMAPEQAAADPHIDHRADIYAVGVLGYELLTGRPPFTGASSQEILAAHLTQAPEAVSVRRPTIAPALAEVIMRCLAKRPADRWQTADELQQQLEALATTTSGGITPTSTVPTGAVRIEDHWYGHPVRVGGLFLLVSAAVLGAAYFLTMQLGLPDWVLRGTGLLLLLGLPIMIATGLVERRRAAARASGVFTSSGESPLHRLVTWRKATLGGVLAFAALSAGTIGYTAMRLLGIGPVATLVASGKLAARDKVLVADFLTRSTDSTLGASVSEAFRIDLAQSQVIGVLGSTAVGSALERMGRDPQQGLDRATAKEVAIREGAKAVVEGEINPVGKGYVLAARVVAAVDGTELVALRETAEDDSQILKALDRLSKRLRERIGESLKSIRANAPLEKVTTSSLEALRLYTEGNRATGAGENDRAIPLLRQAIALDSGFAMAWRKLAVALGNSFASPTEMVDAATRAFRNRDRLPELERRQTTAYYYMVAEVDLDKAVAAYRSTLDLAPEDLTALNNLSSILQTLRQYPEAEQLSARASQLGPNATFFFNLANTQAAQGKMRELDATMARFAQAAPSSPALRFTTGQALVRRGQYDSAQRVFLTGVRDFKDLGTQAGMAFSLGSLAELRGQLREAERHWREFMAISEQRKLPGSYLSGATILGQMQLLLGRDPAKAEATVAEALRQHPLATMPASDRPYSDLAKFHAMAGHPVQGRSLMTEYRAAVPETQRHRDFVAVEAEGHLALAEGKGAEAAMHFRAAYDTSGCTNCLLFELGSALEQANQPDSALAAYTMAAEQPATLDRLYSDFLSVARNYRRLGELYEARGENDKALEYYGQFTALWKDADPELQPQVREVKARMAKLAGEQTP